MEDIGDADISLEINKYIDSIEKICGCSIDINQRRWYQLKSAMMGDSMKQEYPSTPSEAFEASNEGLYYGAQIAQMRREGKICKVPYQASSLVYSVFDIGLADQTAIWFVQFIPGGSINLIDYYEASGMAAKQCADLLNRKGYTYGCHTLPHDADSKHANTGTSWREEFEALIKETVHVIPIAESGILDGIQSVRSILDRCYFDESKCKIGIKALESYKREWNDKLGCYKSAPLHDWSSHCADSFRYLATAMKLGYLGGKSMSKQALDKVKAQAGFAPKHNTNQFHTAFMDR